MAEGAAALQQRADAVRELCDSVLSAEARYGPRLLHLQRVVLLTLAYAAALIVQPARPVG